MPSAPADNIAGEAEEYVVSTAPAGETQRAAAKRGKTVATTKLVVANASGEALHYIPLSISTSSTSGADKPAIRLSGLPTETVLTSGEDLGNGAWLLKPGDEQDLKLAVQSNAPREILIGVEAFEMKTGQLAAPPQDLRVQVLPPKQLLVQPAADTIKPAIEPVAEPSEVEPPTAAKIVPAPELPSLPGVDDSAPEPEVKIASAEPAAVAQSREPAVAKAEVKVAAADPLIVSTTEPYEVAAAPEATGRADPTLTSRGDSLMSMGEVIGARSFYNRAYDRGDMAAARSIARTSIRSSIPS